MRRLLALTCLVAASVVAGSPARAQTSPQIVIPGRPGVPVFINGREASYAVVEGQWGIRDIDPQPVVYGGWDKYEAPPVGHYYPTLGHAPGYGRLEVQPPPNRKLPKPAESFHQSWSARSTPPVSEEIPQQGGPSEVIVPINPPPVIPAQPYSNAAPAPQSLQQYRN